MDSQQIRIGGGAMKRNFVLGVIVSLVAMYIFPTAALAKTEADRPRLGTVLYQTLESLRITALLLAAFMPSTSERMWSQLGIEENLWSQNLKENGKWGGLKTGSRVVKPSPLFPRIDPTKISFSFSRCR
jgi:methionyl-tRNA synthetase